MVIYGLMKLTISLPSLFACFISSTILVKNKDIAEVRCNIVLDDDCSEYMTDFVCTKTNGDLMVRECISTKLLEKPLSMKLLDMSRTYWLRHGVTDWGIVVDAAEE